MWDHTALNTQCSQQQAVFHDSLVLAHNIFDLQPLLLTTKQSYNRNTKAQFMSSCFVIQTDSLHNLLRRLIHSTQCLPRKCISPPAPDSDFAHAPPLVASNVRCCQMQKSLVNWAWSCFSDRLHSALQYKELLKP